MCVQSSSQLFFFRWLRKIYWSKATARNPDDVTAIDSLDEYENTVLQNHTISVTPNPQKRIKKSKNEQYGPTGGQRCSTGVPSSENYILILKHTLKSQIWHPQKMLAAKWDAKWSDLILNISDNAPSGWSQCMKCILDPLYIWHAWCWPSHWSHWTVNIHHMTTYCSDSLTVWVVFLNKSSFTVHNVSSHINMCTTRNTCTIG